METHLEQYIRKFVLGKTEEEVTLHLAPQLHIRSVHKKGSILLAVFWANLLQHPNNFPKRKYSYKKMIDRSTNKEKLVLVVPDNNVTISVTMETGTLTIEGVDEHAWFKHNFTKLLDSYDPSFKEQFVYNSTDSPSRNSRNVTSRSAKVAETDEYIPGLEHLALNEQEFLSDSELSEKLTTLTSGDLQDGYSCVYKIWKTLLKNWCNSDNTSIYMATTRLDKRRLHDVVNCFVKGKFKANLGAFFVPRFCNGGSGVPTTVAELKKAVVKNYKEKRLHVIIEHYVYRNIFLPKNTEFEFNFVAGVCDGKAEVLVTSGGFDAESFRHKNLETVQYLTMEEEEFKQKYFSLVQSTKYMTLL